MLPQTNKAARQLSSSPVARTDTLRSIADRAHSVTERIQYLNTDAKKLGQLLSQVPQAAGSRLDWLNTQLGQS